MESKDFSRKELLEFIECYKERECLWNTRSVLYKRLDLKKEAWEHIAEEFGMTVDFVKRKIKSLRGTYAIERKKKLHKTDDYVPKLSWYDYMDFLSDIIIERRLYINPNSNESDKIKPEKINNESACFDPDLTEEYEDEELIPEKRSRSDSESVAPKYSTSNYIYLPTVDKTTPQEICNDMQNIDEHLVVDKKDRSSATEEVKAFCNWLEATLLKLPEVTCLEAMQNIQGTVMGCRLNTLKNQTEQCKKQ